MKRWLKVGALVTSGIIFAAFAVYWIFEFTDADAQREQYAVYSDYLNNELLNDYHDYGSGHGLLVIFDHSVAPQTSHQLPGASAKMQRQLMLHGLRSTKFERSFRLSVPFIRQVR